MAKKREEAKAEFDFGLGGLFEMAGGDVRLSDDEKGESNP